MSIQKDKYDEYIQSSAWTRKRTKYFKSHKKVCAACGSTVKIHLHHHTYERLGNEHFDDLVPLCEVCHDLVHQRHNKDRSQSLTKVTFDYINSYEQKEPVVPPKPKRKKKKKQSSLFNVKVGRGERRTNSKNTKRAEDEADAKKKICVYCNKPGSAKGGQQMVSMKNSVEFIHVSCRGKIIRLSREKSKDAKRRT